ncbi:MAG: hypothetical protein WED86_00250 [Chloroflexota bacterium]
MAGDGPAPDQPSAEPATRWRRITLAAGAAVVVVVILFIVFGNLLDPGTPSASASSAQEQSPSAGPTDVATTSLSPTNAPATGWTPAEIAGVPWVDGIAERDGRLVAVGRTGIQTGSVVIAYSDDGETWTTVDIAHLGLDIEPQGPNQVGLISLAIAAGEPGFVAVGSRLAADLSVEDLYFFSPDGLDWQTADPPEDCAAGYGVRAVGSAFVKFGEMCVSDGLPPPGPTRVVTSADGRSWTSRLDAENPLGPWTSDGERIVMLIGAGSQDRAGVANSDDGADTWRQIPDAFPEGVSVYSVAWGHDRYVAEASWINLLRPGDPDHAVCASDIGETWTCDRLSSVTAPPEERRAVGAVTSTSTGFASLLMVLDDPFGQIPALTAVLATSADGLAWTFTTVAAMKDTQLGGFVGTSHGVFAWGSTVNADGSGLQEPSLLVHLAPLP